jgi:hypothetical protein
MVILDGNLFPRETGMEKNVPRKYSWILIAISTLSQGRRDHYGPSHTKKTEQRRPTSKP